MIQIMFLRKWGDIVLGGTDNSGSNWCPIRLIADGNLAQNTSISLQAVKNANNRADFTIATYAAGGPTVEKFETHR